MAREGRFSPQNPHKYLGNPTNIFWRSSWELAVMLWCDKSDAVTKWNSEDLIVPYLCPTDNRMHRYYVDFIIKLKTGRVLIVELKPDVQTRPPVQKKKKLTKSYLDQTLAYIKNEAKWKAARQYCEKNNYEFNVWTEFTLDKLNIRKIIKKSK